MSGQESDDRSRYLDTLKAAQQYIGSYQDNQSFSVDEAINLVEKTREYVQACEDSFNRYELAHSKKDIEALQTKLNEIVVNSTKQAKKFTFRSRTQKKPESATSRTESQTETDKISTSEKIENKTEVEAEIVLDLDTKVIEDKSDEVITFCKTDHRNITLKKLNNCTIFILDQLTNIKLFDLNNCRVYCAPAIRSVLIYGANNSIICVAGQQLRLHRIFHSFLFVQSKGIIVEDSDDIQFGLYNLSYPETQKHFKEACLDPTGDSWKEIKDFNWVTSTPSPHWRFLDDQIGKQTIVLTLNGEQVKAENEIPLPLSLSQTHSLSLSNQSL